MNVDVVRRLCRSGQATAPVLAVLMAVSPPARAVDGCKVLLCFAGNWSQISQCVPPVRELFHDLARGRPFPSCDMAGSGNDASFEWANGGNCPIQYSYATPGSDSGGPNYACTWWGVVNVRVSGADWSSVWLAEGGGESVTRYSDAAKTQLGSYDTRFDDDYAAWLIRQQQPVDPGDQGGKGG